MRWLFLLLAAWTALVQAAPSELRLQARETLRVPIAGVLAAFAVDPSTVEVTAGSGEVVLRGRRAGQTLVTIVLPAAVETLGVLVEPAVPQSLALAEGRARSTSYFSSSYDTGTRRLASTLSAQFGEGEHRSRFRLEGLHEQAHAGMPGHSALPFASLELQAPGRTLTLLDQFVRSSPLTLDGTMLRGVHLQQNGLDLHAGMASERRFDDLLIPSTGERAAGLSLSVPSGGLQWQPALTWLPDSAGAAQGVIALGVEHGADRDPLHLRGEIGWGGRPGASFDLDWRGPARQAWLRGRFRPDGFAALKSGPAPGHYVDGAWSEWFGEGTTATLSASANRLDAPGLNSRSKSSRIDLRHQVTQRWSMNGSLGSGDYSGPGVSDLRRETLAFGVAYDEPHIGWSAVYRYQATSTALHGGHGGRLTLRGSNGGWRGNLFVDAQQQAPTVDLILQGRSDLARALTELGIGIGSPEDLIRELRTNAALLAARGVTVGTLQLNPLRLQSGLDVSWRARDSAGPEIGLRVLNDHVETVADSRTAFVGTLYANWRLRSNTELGLAYSRWTARQPLGGDESHDSVQVSLRMTFDKLSLPGEGSRAIVGRVKLDAVANEEAADARGLAGIDVVLDRSRRTRTDADGRFAFESPGPGMHRVEAVLPPQSGAFFTTPSIQTVQSGAALNFGITFSAARLSGIVRSDAGVPLAGVVVALHGEVRATTTTDSSGAYRFAAPAGAARVELVLSSIPAGYDMRSIAPKTVQLAHDSPAAADFVVSAQRSLEGAVSGVAGVPVRVLALEAGREVFTDASGRFVIRGLPAGPVTLIVKDADGEARKVVDLPSHPAVIRHIQLSRG